MNVASIQIADCILYIWNVLFYVQSFVYLSDFECLRCEERMKYCTYVLWELKYSTIERIYMGNVHVSDVCCFSLSNTQQIFYWARENLYIDVMYALTLNCETNNKIKKKYMQRKMCVDSMRALRLGTFFRNDTAFDDNYFRLVWLKIMHAANVSNFLDNNYSCWIYFPKLQAIHARDCFMINRLSD